MPTGYTYRLLEKKQTFQQFALSCARNFGALVEMRDDASDAEIPGTLPLSDYHPKKIKEAERELARLKKLSAKQRRAHGDKLKAKALGYSVKSLRELRANNATLDAVRTEALAWVPPTEDHNGLHKFIVEQLEISMEDEKWRRNSIVEAVMKTPMDFYRESVSGMEREITYHREAYEKEVERNRRNNAWVSSLRESLKGGSDE